MIEESVETVTEALKYTIQHIRQPLEERVFVTVVRGLWDKASKELYAFILGLKEDIQAQVRTLSLAFLPVLNVVSKTATTLCCACSKHGAQDKTVRLFPTWWISSFRIN